MSNFDLHPVHREIAAPVLRDEEALVENIYRLPGTEAMPDLESQDVMGEYLYERFEPEAGPQIRVVLTPSGRSMPGIQRVPAGFKEVTRLRKADEWFISPRLAAGIMLGSAALFNAIGNADTIAGAARYTGHAIYRVFEPVEDRTVLRHHTITTPGRISKIDVTADTANRVGTSRVNPAAIEHFVHKVEDAENDGGHIRQIRIVGNASDEWATEASIGTKDAQNALLEKARAEAAVEALKADGLKVKSPLLSIGEKEHVLTAKEQSTLLTEAKRDGYPDIKAAIDAVDGEQLVPKGLAQRVKQLFNGKRNRGVSLSATIERPGKATVTNKTTKVIIPGKDNPPAVPNPHWYWFIPMLPIRKRERYYPVKQVSRWEFTASRPILRPQVIIEDKDQAWVRLRPEAVGEDGTLVSDSWAYTRKYEHLLRDNRIADLLRADFVDANGEEKSLRILFVDKSPAQETIDAFEVLLKKFAAMEGGKLGDRVSAIFVYPSENAGTDHDDPKRIAMGIDKQSSESILGTYTYPLDLVELHMPSTWDRDELLRMFEEFNGPRWVLAHEVGGHGTDESDETLRLQRVHALGIPNAHVIKGDPRASKMRSLSKVLRKLPSRFSRKESIMFDIEYPVTDNIGQTVTRHARVQGKDPQLAHATISTIVGYRPTQYAGTNEADHYAETAASVTTGIPVPYEEASVSVERLVADNGEQAVFATGYRPDKRGQRTFTRSTGAIEGLYPVSFRHEPAVRISHINPYNDSLIRRELKRTHGVRTLYPAQMVAILARVARRAR